MFSVWFEQMLKSQLRMMTNQSLHCHCTRSLLPLHVLSKKSKKCHKQNVECSSLVFSCLSYGMKELMIISFMSRRVSNKNEISQSKQTTEMLSVNGPVATNVSLALIFQGLNCSLWVTRYWRTMTQGESVSLDLYDFFFPFYPCWNTTLWKSAELTLAIFFHMHQWKTRAGGLEIVWNLHNQ